MNKWFLLFLWSLFCIWGGSYIFGLIPIDSWAKLPSLLTWIGVSWAGGITILLWDIHNE